MSNSFHVSQVSRGQAYAILGGAALMMTLAMGIRQNLGLFQAPASKELAPSPTSPWPSRCSRSPGG
jgi:hypothetical protein